MKNEESKNYSLHYEPIKSKRHNVILYLHTPFILTPLYSHSTGPHEM